MSLLKRIKGGNKLIAEARDALEKEAAEERERNPVWKRRKGETDEDLILVSDKKPGREEIIIRQRTSTFVTQEAVRGARLSPVYMQRAVLERMAKDGVERAIHALEEERLHRAARTVRRPEKGLPPGNPKKRYRFTFGDPEQEVKVRAGSEAEARYKAILLLKKRAAKADPELARGANKSEEEFTLTWEDLHLQEIY